MFFNKNKNLMKKSTIKPKNKVDFRQKTLLIGDGEINFGEGVAIGFFPSPYFFSTYAHIEAREENSKIFIDDNTIINNNCCIVCNATEIKIGKNCRIGANFQCLDSDFHGLSAKNRDNPNSVISKPTTIGDNVFIGNNVMVLKGVTIGNNSVIGGGSVVLKDIPENTIAGGNPAKVIKPVE